MTENLMRQMKKASDLEVCEKIIMLAREVIEENGNHDIRLYARDRKVRSDIKVCEKIITLAREVIKENGNHDIRLYAKDSKGRILK